MFIGSYFHNLDSKGRIIIPAKFRDELSDSFILTKGFDGCLTVYSNKQWERLFEEVNKLPTTKKAAREYVRMLAGNASECELDNQGRIQIPSFLAAPAHIVKECAIIGVNDHIEIWDKDCWDKYYQDANENFEEVAENLNDFIND